LNTSITLFNRVILLVSGILLCTILVSCSEINLSQNSPVEVATKEIEFPKETSEISQPAPTSSPKEKPRMRTPSQTPTETPKATRTITATSTATAEKQNPEPTITATIISEEQLSLSSTPAGEEIKTSDLLYISDGDLYRWDHVTDYSSLLLENIEEYKVSTSGKTLVAQKSRNITANGMELFDLVVLDLDTKKAVTLLQSIPSLEAFSPSPDGNSVAYITGEPEFGLFLVQLDEQNNHIFIENCLSASDLDCDSIHWSPDSLTFAWKDENGIRIYTDYIGKSYISHENLVEIIDPKGNRTEILVDLVPKSWSPENRYLLVEVIPSDDGVHWHGILDTKRRFLQPIPESFQYSGIDSCAVWTNEGYLLVGHSGNGENESPAYIELWEIVPTNPEMLQALGRMDIQNEHMLPTGIQENATLFPNWMHSLGPSQVLFGLSELNGSTSTQITLADLDDGTLEELIIVPYHVKSINWSPDGEGALVKTNDSGYLFVPFDGSMIRELDTDFGEGARDLFWMPPSPRILSE
jgi:hypothetical protein